MHPEPLFRPQTPDESFLRRLESNPPPGPPRLLSLCTGMGLFDRAFLDSGFEVEAGCEIDPAARRVYARLCGGAHLAADLRRLPRVVAGREYAGVIGGPPCQARSRTRNMHGGRARFLDLTPEVRAVLGAVRAGFYLFENVAPLAIPGAACVRLDAMHFAKPHQNRPRYFTYRGLIPPEPAFAGDSESLMAYPSVTGKVYGTRRAAILQGYPGLAALPFPADLLRPLVGQCVHYAVGLAWAAAAREALGLPPAAGDATA